MKYQRTEQTPTKSKQKNNRERQYWMFERINNLTNFQYCEKGKKLSIHKLPTSRINKDITTDIADIKGQQGITETIQQINLTIYMK